VVSGETTLFVLRLDYLPGNDNITLFLNPTLGDPEPAATFGTVKSDLDLLNTTGFGLYSTGAFSFDEFRLGSTFASVTPVAAVPEPGSAMGLLIVLGTALYRRRRTPKS